MKLGSSVEADLAVVWTAELINYTVDTTAQLLASLRRLGVVE
ncbi:MAG: hypothetical protein QGI49_09785 [SAR202 cluster bacterium]|nr:hypothetical protein [SAR202 cluster bacterium]